MENLMKSVDEQKLANSVWKVLYDAVDDRKHKFFDSRTDIKQHIQEYLSERVHEHLTGWTSYYDGSAKELRTYLNTYAHEFPSIDACEAVCQYIWNSTRKYKLSLAMEYSGDDTDVRYYNGDNFENDCYNVFLRNNKIDLTKLTTIESNNLRQLIVYFGSRYLRRGTYTDDDINDLQNLIVQFVGITYRVADLQNWLGWLKTSSSLNVHLQKAAAEDLFYIGEPLEEVNND